MGKPSVNILLLCIYVCVYIFSPLKMLAVPNARFLLGEVCVGLSHVHAAGFAFGDLKPRPPHTASGEAVNGVAA